MSKLILNERNIGNLEGIQVKRGYPILSHLLLADDSMFFLKASQINLLKMKRNMNLYCKASGQTINFDNLSMVFNSFTLKAIRLAYCDVFGINPNNSLSNYLGLPSLWSRSKYKILKAYRDKIFWKLQGWKGNLLSPKGKGSSH